MKFLKLFWRTLREYIHNFSTQSVLNFKDKLGRYLTSSSHFSEKNDRVKYNALMPIKNSSTDKFETSIFNIEGLTSDEVEGIAKTYILPKLANNRSIYGTGTTQKIDIEGVGLKVQISEPPERHLNIIGWPEEKSKQKQLAMELAPLCNLSLFKNKLQAVND